MNCLDFRLHRIVDTEFIYEGKFHGIAMEYDPLENIFMCLDIKHKIMWIPFCIVASWLCLKYFISIGNLRPDNTDLAEFLLSHTIMDQSSVEATRSRYE